MIKRITYRVVDDNSAHVRLSVWVNGGLITGGPGGITLRKEELEDFIDRLDAFPDSEVFSSWTCEVCCRERPNAKISVLTTKNGNMERNMKYCNDNTDCLQKVIANAMAEERKFNEN